MLAMQMMTTMEILMLRTAPIAIRRAEPESLRTAPMASTTIVTASWMHRIRIAPVVEMGYAKATNHHVRAPKTAGLHLKRMIAMVTEHVTHQIQMTIMMEIQT